MARIFISYSRKDEDIARRLATDLEARGASVWIDVDDIPAGMNWSTAIQEGLDACDVLILLISPESMASSNVEDEWQYVRDEGKPIIPILWQPTDRMHFQLRRIQYISFHNQSYELSLHQLHARLLDHDNTLDDLPPAPKGESVGDRRITPGTTRKLTMARELTGHRNSVLDVAIHPESSLLASGSEDKNVRFWHTNRRSRIKMMIGHEKPVNAVDFSPSGSFLASASDDRTVRLWHTGKRYGIAALRGHTAPVLDVDYSPTETLLASGSEDGTVRLWDAKKRTLSVTLTEHNGPVTAVQFSPDGSALASAGSDLSLRLWDVTGHGIITDYELSDEARSLAFSPDGSLLAVGLADTGVQLLEVRQNPALWENADDGEEGEPVMLVSLVTIYYADYNARCVRGVAFSPDGSLLAMASLDGTIRLWKTESLREGKQGRALKVLRGHEGGVTGVAFSPDGTLLASSSHDGTLRMWDTSS